MPLYRMIEWVLSKVHMDVQIPDESGLPSVFELHRLLTCDDPVPQMTSDVVNEEIVII